MRSQARDSESGVALLWGLQRADGHFLETETVNMLALGRSIGPFDFPFSISKVN